MRAIEKSAGEPSESDRIENVGQFQEIEDQARALLW